jgi:hypothetical protein
LPETRYVTRHFAWRNGRTPQAVSLPNWTLDVTPDDVSSTQMSSV